MDRAYPYAPRMKSGERHLELYSKIIGLLICKLSDTVTE